MGVPVILTPQAQADLRQIVEHVAQDSPDRAIAWGNGLIDRALFVGEFPAAGRLVPEERNPSVREVVEGSYRIIYEIFEDPPRVYILRFWHGARGVPELTRQKSP